MADLPLMKCFVISPIGEDESEIRRQSDNVFEFIISPVVSELGYEPVRADKIGAPGIITHQIINHLLNSNLVIADLSGNNPNVYYELAVRHAFNKPVIHINHRNNKLPFDVTTIRCILYDHQDLRWADKCKEHLKDAVQYIHEHPDEKILTPVTQTTDLNSMKTIGDGNEALGILADMIGKLSTKIGGIDNQIQELQYSMQPNIYYAPSYETFNSASPIGPQGPQGLVSLKDRYHRLQGLLIPDDTLRIDQTNTILKGADTTE